MRKPSAGLMLDLVTLKRVYRKWQVVGRMLGVSTRHLRGIRTGTNAAGSTLEILARLLASHARQISSDPTTT